MGYLCTDRPKTLLLQLLIGMFFFFNTALSIMFHVQRAYLWEPLRARRQEYQQKTKRCPFSRPDTGQVRLLRVRRFAVPRIRIKQR